MYTKNVSTLSHSHLLRTHPQQNSDYKTLRASGMTRALTRLSELLPEDQLATGVHATGIRGGRRDVEDLTAEADEKADSDASAPGAR
jgi:hypothetical protein